MPVYPPPPPPLFPVPVPAPMPFIAPALFPIIVPQPDETSSMMTTTTTTQKPENQVANQVAFGVPIPVPMPMPMPMPMPVPIAPPVSTKSPNICQGPPPRPTKCPPCPPCVCKPSCTPSFFSFCSPCHLKCRCKRRDDMPAPLPPAPPAPSYAIQIGPPPVVVVPLPPHIPIRPSRRPKKTKPIYSSFSDSSETSSSEFDDLRSRKNRRRKANIYRRSLRSSENENELVKPMLSYVAENGDIKFETKIDDRDVAQLLGERSNAHQTVRVVTGNDEESKPQVIVYSNNEDTRRHRGGRHKKVYLRGGVSNHVLGDGKKQLIFRPSGDKKINNLSLSFQIS
ncbi:unnamed protein product, partial [Brenthis ino]